MIFNADLIKEVIISEEEIDKRVRELGREITIDYQEKDVILISVLNGSFMFTSDLLKCINLDCRVDFIQVSTYGNSTKSSGNFTMLKDLSMDISGKDVIIIEDIIDSGYTLSNLKKYLITKNPASVAIASFIDKPHCRAVDVDVAYTGFVLKDDKFIVGYGLDFAQKYRNLPYVCVLKEEVYTKNI